MTEPRPGLLWTLIVISCVLVVLATLALGIQQVLLNTDRWVSVVGPLASDARVQSSVADTAATLTLNALDLHGRAQSLPGPLQTLVAPVEATIATFVDDQALRLVQSPPFQAEWVDVNRAAHQQLVQLLRGESTAAGALRVSDGQVQLNLIVVIMALLQRVQQSAPDIITSALTAAGIGYVNLVQASALVTLQQAVQWLDRLTLVLLVAAPIMVGITLLLSHQRRTTTMWLGTGVVLGMLLAGIGVWLAQQRLVAAVADSPISGAVQIALGAAFLSLGQFLLVAGVVALAVAVIAYLARRAAVAS